MLCFVYGAVKQKHVSAVSFVRYAGSDVQADAGNIAVCIAPAGLLAVEKISFPSETS